MRRHLAAVLLLTNLVALAIAAPASASCAMLPGSLKQRLETAPHLFVGTVTRLGAGGRAAEVQVESTWRGEADATVQIVGGETGAGVSSSVDRTYEMGRRYLFVPYGIGNGAYLDNSCTDTQPWRKRLDRLRPDGAAAVDGAVPAVNVDDAEPEAPPGRSVAPWIAGGAVLVAAAAAGMVTVRSRR